MNGAGTIGAFHCERSPEKSSESRVDPSGAVTVTSRKSADSEPCSRKPTLPAAKLASVVVSTTCPLTDVVIVWPETVVLTVYHCPAVTGKLSGTVPIVVAVPLW